MSGAAPLKPLETSTREEGFFRMEHCSVVFGGLRAVKDVSFSLSQGELTGLIGPNGAGKTTIFNLITGVYVPTTGHILFDGQQIAGPLSGRDAEAYHAGEGDRNSSPDNSLDSVPDSSPEGSARRRIRMRSRSRRDITRAGICRTFQNIRLFQGLTVLENVLTACSAHHRESLATAMLRTASYYRTEAATRQKAMDLLAALQLESFAGAQARSLPYGAQRRLEIARALATDPRLLLLDEPAAGMNPQESSALMEMIHWVRRRFDLTILLIEHDMKVVMGMCERVLVLVDGALIADGTPEAVRANPRVVAAYLGEPEE